MKLTKVLAVVFALTCVVALAACKVESSTSAYSQITLSEASGVKVEAQNAGSDMEALTEEAIEVRQGDVIVISPDLTQGSIHVTITPSKGGAAIYDSDATGRVLYTIEAAPGEYDVKTRGNGATGSMTVFAQSSSELAAQDAALTEGLENAGVEVDESLTDHSEPSNN